MLYHFQEMLMQPALNPQKVKTCFSGVNRVGVTRGGN